MSKTTGLIAWGRIVLGLVLLLVSWNPRSISAQRPPTGHSDTAESDATARKSGLQSPSPAPSFQGIAHTSWTRRDGAPGGIKTLAQTKDGYLWIGSSLGLCRFDGLRFFQYPLGSSTPSLDICSLAADLDGGLWIAMCSATIVHLQTDGSMVTYSDDDGVPTGALDKVICRPDGSVWLAGSGKLLRLEGKRWIDFGKAHGIGPDGVFAVMFDREGNIWISRDERLSVLRHGFGQLEDVPNQVHLVSSMIQSRDGEIWLGDAWRSIRRLSDNSTKGILALKGKPELLVDSHDNLWVAQDDQGLSRILHISDHSTPPGVEHGTNGDLTSQQTMALLEDREGNIWVGTERGLDRFRETPFVHFLDAGLHYFPSLIAADDGSVWIDSLGSSLMHVVDGETIPVGLKVHSGPFAKRRNGDICFMDMISYEVQCYGRDAPVHVKITAPTRHVHSLAMVEDTDSSLPISLQGEGLWRYSNGNWDQPTAPGLPKSSPWSMFSDVQGRLWLGYGNDAIVVRTNGVYRTLHIRAGSWSTL